MVVKKTDGDLPRPEDDPGSLALLLSAFGDILERAHALNREAEELLHRLFADTDLPPAAQPASHRRPERRKWRRD
jgi:hypothetical protein